MTRQRKAQTLSSSNCSACPSVTGPSRQTPLFRSSISQRLSRGTGQVARSKSLSRTMSVTQNPRPSLKMLPIAETPKCRRHRPLRLRVPGRSISVRVRLIRRSNEVVDCDPTAVPVSLRACTNVLATGCYRGELACPRRFLLFATPTRRHALICQCATSMSHPRPTRRAKAARALQAAQRARGS